MVGVEDQPGAVRALSYIKEQYGIKPRLVVCDFSPSLISAVTAVYGLGVLQIDGFHVMQLLNNGIRKDLAIFLDKMFRSEIKELFNLRRWLGELQKEAKKENPNFSPLLAAPPSINAKHQGSSTCFRIAMDFLRFFTLNAAHEFEWSVKEEILLLSQTSKKIPVLEGFCAKIKGNIPIRPITDKGRKRLQGEILKRLKGLCLDFRKPLELEKKKFNAKKWALFFQPEKLTAERQATLDDLLEKYPALEEYRQLTLQVGSIYRKKLNEITRDEIGNLDVCSHYSNKLKAAIQTLKGNQDSIYRFVDVFKANPEMGNECRANTEFLNRDFKAPFKHGLSCVGETNLKAKISLQMGCEVRWFLSAA